jgi:hypothetical protein
MNLTIKYGALAFAFIVSQVGYAAEGRGKEADKKVIEVKENISSQTQLKDQMKLVLYYDTPCGNSHVWTGQEKTTVKNNDFEKIVYYL